MKISSSTKGAGRRPALPVGRQARGGSRGIPAASGSRGFTLVEVMVALTVVGLLAAVAMPSFVTVLNNGRLAGQANELLATIQFARTEAIRTSGRVTFCGTASDAASTDDDCSAGTQPFWVVLGRAEGGGQEQLRLLAVRDPLQVSTDLEVVSFGPDGMARDPLDASELLSGDIVVCLAARRPAQNRRVLGISPGGRVGITTPAEDGEGEC